MDYDLVSFDLDGTLVDTAAEICEAANMALQAHAIAARPHAQITALIGAGTRELMHRLLARCVGEQPALAQRIDEAAVLASFEAAYALTSGSSAQPYPGCREALAQLQQVGVRLACVTNKELHHARRVLQATRLEGHFALVIGGDSLDEKKPHASVLRHVVDRLGVAAARSAHVGDSAIDVAAARNAGLAAWAVPYGYNGGVPIAQAGPDRMFETLAQLAEHVLGRGRAAA
jgi:phosphoglycolate phosphatase